MDTPAHTGKAAALIDAAERHMRNGGYGAVSFRDLAAEVGIKSASVHYHFPKKTDLGVAVVNHYREKFFAGLAAPDDPAETVSQRVERLCGAYRDAVLVDHQVCLCCVLGAESHDLPPPVAEAVARFFTRLLSWTETALTTRTTTPLARSAPQIIASLQGSMILALATNRPALFTDTADAVMAAL